MKKIIFLLGILSIIGVVFFLISTIVTNKPLPQIPSSFPTPTPVVPGQVIPSVPILSPLQKTVINQTTDQQVQQIPNTTSSQSAQQGESIYTYPSVNILVPNEIHTENGIVIFERTSTFTSDPGGLPSLKSEMAKLGQPEHIINGNAIYGPVASSFIYSKKGIALIGNIYTDETYEIQQFTPMPLLDYLRKYGNIVQSEEPQDRFQL